MTRLGSQMTIDGKKVISTSTTTSGTSGGMHAFTTSSKLSPETCCITNRIIPKGGVISPIMRFNTMTTPK